jgi:hypothetical protein
VNDLTREKIEQDTAWDLAPAVNTRPWPEPAALPWGTEQEYGAIWLTDEERDEMRLFDDPDQSPNGWFHSTSQWPRAWFMEFVRLKQEIYRRQARREITIDQQCDEIQALLNRYRCAWG